MELGPTIGISTVTSVAISTIFKIFDGPLETVKNYWYCNYGFKSDLERKKMEVLVNSEVDKYKQEIFGEVNKIPKEKLVKPNPAVIMQSFDMSKNFIYEDDLRKMFAKLIASACNADTTYLTHPAFPFIISQLSPFEAKILKDTKILISDLPCCKIRYQEIDNDENKRFSRITKGHDVLRQFIVFDNLDISIEDLDLYKSLLDNLTRLNLCEVPESYELSEEQYYNKYLNISSLNQVLEQYKKIYNTENFDIKFIKKTSRPTDLGRLFYKICIEEH